MSRTPSSLFPTPPDRVELTHASLAADHLLTIVAAQNPQLRPTADLHDATAGLLLAMAAVLAVAGAVQ